MLRATVKSLLARKLRLLLSGTAVVLGVAFVCGTFVLTDTLSRVFDDLFATATEDTDVIVRAADEDVRLAGAGVPREVVDVVAGVDGVAAATPYVEGYAQVVLPDGSAYTTGGAPSFGQSWTPDEELNPFTLREGRAPAAPDEVVLDAGTAEATGYEVGDRVPVLTRAPPQEFTLVGIAGFGESDNLAGASIATFTVDRAVELLGSPGRVTQVEARGADGVTPDELVERVAPALPDDLEAVTGQQAADEAAGSFQEALGFFTTFLLVFAGIALLVGAFLIFNTFSMLVAQRVRELALLRALGASRAQVTGSVLLEAVVVGLGASVLGLGLGLLLAVGLRALVNSFSGGSLPEGQLVVAPRTVLVAVLVGVLVTAVAALLPARRAATVPPVAALRDAALPATSGRRTLVLGAVLVVAGIGLLVPGLSGELTLLGLGGLLLFLGVAALSPLVAGPVAGAVGSLFARQVPGRLGRRNAMRNPRRTATTAAALMVGLALVSAVSVLGASLKSSVASIVDAAFGADLVVQDESFAGLSPQLAETLRERPEVARADALRFAELTLEGGTRGVTSIPAGAVGVTLGLEEVDGDVTALREGGLLLNEEVATELGMQVGDRTTAELPLGDLDLQLLGTYETTQLAGEAVVHESATALFGGNGLDAVVLVARAEGATSDELRAAVDAVADDYPNATIQDRQEFVDTQAAQVDGLLVFVNVLLLLSVVIAVLGIVNTLALSVVERTRELGMLRAVGLSRRQTRRMIRVEAVIVAVFGALLGVALGTPLGIAVQRALVDQGFTELEIPVGTLVVAVLGAALAGVLAAALPARRAARLDVLRALHTE